MFTEAHFTELKELLDFLYSLDEGFVFRGQSNSTWELTTTLERSLEGVKDFSHFAQTSETYVKDMLKSRIHHYFHRDEVPTSELGWLSIAQHHGAPTRLLDFTRYPLVALYFGSRNLRSTDPNFAVWALNFRDLNDDCETLLKNSGHVDSDPDGFFDECERIDHDAPQGAWIGEPRKVNLRLERQGGTFLIPTQHNKPIREYLKESHKRSNFSAHKITVCASLAHEIRRFLQKSGVTASRLFDGVDGLAQEISEEIDIAKQKA